MSCPRYKLESKGKAAHITYYQSELLYDIGNAAWIESSSLSPDERDKHSITDLTQEGNKNRVLRQLDLAWREVLDMLYPYCKVELSGCRVYRDNELVDEPELYLTLQLVPGMSATSIDLVAALVHEWIVARVLYDWLGITYPEHAAKWLRDSETIKSKILSAMNKRTGSIRRPMTPF